MRSGHVCQNVPPVTAVLSRNKRQIACPPTAKPEYNRQNSHEGMPCEMQTSVLKTLADAYLLECRLLTDVPVGSSR